MIDTQEVRAIERENDSLRRKLDHLRNRNGVEYMVIFLLVVQNLLLSLPGLISALK